MKLCRSFLIISLLFSLGFVAFLTLPIQTSIAQDSKIALQRGFRTGYSDGYMAGYRDSIDNAVKDFKSHSDYAKANRAYSKEFGSIEDYADGYRQGFETGYGTGFEKKTFEASVPANLTRRGTEIPVATVTEQPQQEVSTPPAETPAPAPAPAPAQASSQPSVSDSVPVADDSFKKASFTPVSDAVIIIPKDTELIVELIDEMSTSRSRPGDKFTAKIVSPAEITGAVIEGRISKIGKPGHIKKRSEIQLSFDRIILTETRWSNFNALLTEVLPVKGDNVKRVDNEGLAVGDRPYKKDAITIGAATGTGVVIGAIAGGPVGAAVGAGVGAAFGVGAVVIERGKHINLNRNQQLRVRTSYETQIR